MKLWQGLGYYSRARNLHKTAKTVVDDHGGTFPNSYNELIKLKGIGDYTASAIASICFNEPRPVVDGNVYRVLARYFGVELVINSSEGTKYFKQLATEMMETANIRDYNQGIMEFGAIQCAPKNPHCEICPLGNGCVAFQTNKVDRLPIKKAKNKVRNRFFNYLVPLTKDKKTLLTQRRGKGIWQNLWEFPLFESDLAIDLETMRSYVNDVIAVKDGFKIYPFNETPIVHKLSHQHLHTTFWIVETNGKIDNQIDLSELDKYPVPVLISDFLNTFKNSYF